MVLAAGQGTRLRPLTDKVPKPMVEVAGKPLLQHQVERLRDLGCELVVVNCARMGNVVREFFGSGEKLGVSMEYSDEGDMPLGTAAGVRKALPLLGERPFWLVSGDAWCDYGQLPPPAAGDLASVLMVGNPPHNEAGDFFMDGGRLSLSGGTRLTYSGVGLYLPRFFKIGESDHLGDLLAAAAGQGKASASLHQGYWVDVGTAERLEQAEQLALSRNR